MMDKREMIERALGQCLDSGGLNPIARESIVDALADQAIVIPVEVEHIGEQPMRLASTFIQEDPNMAALHCNYIEVDLDGHHGTPGKALAIIVPLEND